MLQMSTNGQIPKNFYKKEICAVCSEEHNTMNCKNDNKVKCGNCGGEHRADDRDCLVYKRASQRKPENNRNRFQITHTRSAYKKFESRRASTTKVTQQAEVSSYSRALQGHNGDHNNKYEANENGIKSITGEGGFRSTWNDIKVYYKNLILKKY